jgi:hypothetical protein
MSCDKLIENIKALHKKVIDRSIFNVRYNINTIMDLIKSEYTHIPVHIYNWSWICTLQTKWGTDVNYSNCTDGLVEVLVFEFIDRGVLDWDWFSNKLRQMYPNLKVLIFGQDFSYSEYSSEKIRLQIQEESFLQFIETMNLDLFLLFDFQTSWLIPYKPARFAYASPKWPENTMIL